MDMDMDMDMAYMAYMECVCENLRFSTEYSIQGCVCTRVYLPSLGGKGKRKEERGKKETLCTSIAVESRKRVMVPLEIQS